jgi:hypothetical protein
MPLFRDIIVKLESIAKQTGASGKASDLYSGGACFLIEAFRGVL